MICEYFLDNNISHHFKLMLQLLQAVWVRLSSKVHSKVNLAALGYDTLKATMTASERSPLCSLCILAQWQELEETVEEVVGSACRDEAIKPV